MPSVQPETSNFDTTVYQYQSTDPVQGNVGSTPGVANQPLQNLTNRTRWLYNQIEAIINGTLSPLPTWIAPLNSPNFQGSPTAPNQAPGNNSQLIANTDFVQSAVNGLANVNCAGGSNIVLTAAQYGVGIIVLTGTLTGSINVIFPSQSGKWIVANATTGAFTVTLKTAGGFGVTAAQNYARLVYGDATNLYWAESDQSGATNFSSIIQAIFSNGTFADPDPGVTRDAKFGQNGIAVKGGTKTDSLTVLGQALVAAATGSGAAVNLGQFPLSNTQAEFPNGLVLQYGLAGPFGGVGSNIGDTAQATVTFPAFQTECLVAFGIGVNAYGYDEGAEWNVGLAAYTVSSATFLLSRTSGINTGGGEKGQILYFALGF